jgi:Ca2+-transporting ATPase
VLDAAHHLMPIMIIVALNVLWLALELKRTNQAVVALQAKVSGNLKHEPTTSVRRNGQIMRIPAQELVPGDIFFLQTGEIVAADGRVLDSANLRIQESSLTGEAYPVDKTPHVLNDRNIPLGERFNMVYMGTTVVFGRGLAIVVATETCTNCEAYRAVLDQYC